MAAKLKNLDQNLPSSGLLQARDQRKKEKTGKIAGASFNELLEQEEVAAVPTLEQKQEILQNHLSQIEEAGWKLQKAPTRSALREYRRLIQGFLEQSLKGLYNIDEELGRLNFSTGQRKKYSLIRVIDQKLEELVRTVLHEQSANLQILQRIEQINGLLINLLS